MTEGDLDKAVAANSDERENLILALASRPNETLPMAINALTHPPQARWDVAVRLIRRIGYPSNSLAIPALVSHLSDPNWLGWTETIRTLEDIGPDIVIPFLIEVLWDEGRTNRYWADDVEGICAMLCQVDTSFAIGCGPAIVHLLTLRSRDVDPDTSWLLDVLEKIGPDCARYSLPALIDIMTHKATTDEKEQAHRLIATFDLEALKVYGRILDSNLYPRS